MPPRPSRAALEKIISETRDLIRAVRKHNDTLFQNTVTDMVKTNLFSPSECIVLTIARRFAQSLGVSSNQVQLVPMHNGWSSAQFVHRALTPMPPPAIKGLKPQPPVLTETLYKVIRASGRIKLVREALPTHEDELNLGGEELLLDIKRPSTSPPVDGSSSTPTPPAAGDKNTGGKGKKKKGKGDKKN